MLKLMAESYSEWSNNSQPSCVRSSSLDIVPSSYEGLGGIARPVLRLDPQDWMENNPGGQSVNLVEQLWRFQVIFEVTMTTFNFRFKMHSLLLRRTGLRFRWHDRARNTSMCRPYRRILPFCWKNRTFCSIFSVNTCYVHWTKITVIVVVNRFIPDHGDFVAKFISFFIWP